MDAICDARPEKRCHLGGCALYIQLKPENLSFHLIFGPERTLHLRVMVMASFLHDRDLVWILELHSEQCLKVEVFLSP